MTELSLLEQAKQLLETILTPDVLSQMTEEQEAEINKARNTKIDEL